jgi:hypothetical protein
VALPGGRVEKDLQEIIRLQRESNGTLLPGQKTTAQILEEQRKAVPTMNLIQDRDEQRMADAKANAITNAEGIKQEFRAQTGRQITAADAIRAALQVAADASRATTQAIKDKDLNVTVPVAVSISQTISVRDQIKTQTTFKKLGGSYIS